MSSKIMKKRPTPNNVVRVLFKRFYVNCFEELAEGIRAGITRDLGPNFRVC